MIPATTASPGTSRGSMSASEVPTPKVSDTVPLTELIQGQSLLTGCVPRCSGLHGS